MSDSNFEIIEHIGVFSESASGWTKELNIVKWYDNEPKYDIRVWSPDHKEGKQGITLTEDELSELKTVINSIDASVSRSNDVSEEWQETLEQIISESVREFADECIELGIPAPSSVGYELEVDGEVVGEAEFVWESLNIAMLTPEQEDSANAFISEGWQIISFDDEIVPSLFLGDYR